MADGENTSPVAASATGLDASAADFVPLDDSDSSNDQDSPTNGQDEDEDDDDDDSASDVSMAAETDDESDVEAPSTPSAPAPRNEQPSTAAPATAPPIQNHDEVGELASRKRKSLADVPDEQNLLDTQEVKKVKIQRPGHNQLSNGSLVCDRSALPAEIWHYIFTFCPPRTLGKLLLVNRLFNSYLDPSSTIRRDEPCPLSVSALALMKPNSIWQASRRRFWPTMPTPLQDKAELYMWQLSCSTSCQFCGKPAAAQQPDSPEPWQSGPGQEGVSIIWSFASRSCGACLLSKSIKEIDILLSSSIPSALTAALPFVFVTQDLHVISPSTVEKGQTPPNTSLTKLYWGPYVEELKQEFFTVKAMGTATAEEWLKGLDPRGKERRSDASRWENWAISSGGLKQMRSLLYPGYRMPPAPIANRAVTSDTATGVASVPQIPGLGLSYDNSRPETPSPSSQRNGATPDPFRRSSTGTASLPPNRAERTKEQVAELKATRKAEIERRALELDPPLPANILAQIPSFQAALQIINPMDDHAWETLKPRLLAQRGDAEQREKENAARVKREMDEKKASSTASKEAREAEDADWDEIQAPVRARIAGFADEIIRDGWEDGDKVGRDNCSKFAVEVLTYIRKRFYAEVAKDAAAARAAGKSPVEDPPQGPFTQKLTLENMKWIFDVKVKPHTERHRKEIFLCNGCDVTVRYYGFEGVIQHYAAKHTNALSIGNVVVHWRAEWPEHPPFTWESKPAKNGQYQSQPPVPGYTAYSQTPQQSYQPPPPGGPTPTPAYVPPSWNDPYGQAPQAPYPAAATGYAPPQAYGTTPYPADPYASFAPAQGQHGGYPGPAPPSSTGQYNYNYGAYQSNNQVGFQAVQPAPFSAQYRSQLEEMARMARELWNATANMKDTLSIVRVQVVVFHLAKRFHAKFGIPLPLATFIDGLSNHKDMRPVRNVNGLICRVCHHGVGGYVASDEERKSYSLPQLTAHFQTKHVDPFGQNGQYGQPPEWTVDMVLLPEPAAVPNLRAAVTMDGQKYHLVNEAVPHLLSASGTSQAATNAASAWQDHGTYYPGYQGSAVDGQTPYYGQSQPNVPQQDITAGQYQTTAVPPAQSQTLPVVSYNYTEPPPVISMPPTTVYTPPEPISAAVHNVATGRGSDLEGRSSQGHRQGRDQNHRNSKKNKKRGLNVRDNDDAEARRREEEAAKMAEEEAEREGDVIRAMWAADRAKTARKSALPETEAPENRSKTDNKSGKSSRPSSKPGTPQPRQRFQSRPPRDSPRASPRRFEGSTSGSTPEARLPPVPPAQRDVNYRGHQLSNVTYMDGRRDEPPPRDGPGTPGGYERYDRPPSRPMERRRSRSPVYIDLNRPPPAQQYRQRTPPRQQPLERDPGYHPASNSRPPAVPLDDARYDRPAPPSRRDDYIPRDYAGPALIEYEIIEYRNPDGTTWIEERPLRRIPNSESERYYRDAHAHPHPPVSYDRGEPLAPAPYHREPLPPPHHPPSPATAGARETYRAPPYEASSYSRAPQYPHPPASSSVAGAGSAAMYEYDPRRPSETIAPSRLPPQPPSRTANGPTGYYGGGGQQQQHAEDEGDDDYDPRFPAAPPSAVAPGPGPGHGPGAVPVPRMARHYQ